MSDRDREWAAAQVPRLLEQARAEALEEARAQLRRRLVDALLDAAADPPASERAQPAAPPPDRDRAPRPGTGVWVYGVVPERAEAPAAAGVEGTPVRLVAAAGLAALASPVPLDRFGEEALERSLEDMATLEALARAHQGVLDAALDLGGVVPFRLCTIYASESHVREMLERERGTLAPALDRLRGAAEWGVKAYQLDAAHSAPEPVAREAGSGTEWIEQRREDRAAAADAEAEAERRAAAVHARLGEHANAAVLSRPQDRRLSGHEGEMVLNAAYLVPTDRAAGFRDLVGVLAREHEPHGLRLELTGPWPAYNFVAEAEGT